MAITTKIDPIGKDFLLSFVDEMTPEGRSRALASFAREQLAEAQKINQSSAGYVPGHDIFVDGVKGAVEESVRPDGVIVYDFHLLREVLEWIEQKLLDSSPIKSGRYRKSHILLADGAEVQFFSSELPQAERYVFSNVQPYARKIERGLSRQTPAGVFQVVADMAKRRFGNIASIKFTYEGIIFGNTALEQWARRTKQRRRIAPKTTDAWNRRQPAIEVMVK